MKGSCRSRRRPRLIEAELLVQPSGWYLQEAANPYGSNVARLGRRVGRVALQPQNSASFRPERQNCVFFQQLREIIH